MSASRGLPIGCFEFLLAVLCPGRYYFCFSVSLLCYDCVVSTTRLLVKEFNKELSILYRGFKIYTPYDDIDRLHDDIFKSVPFRFASGDRADHSDRTATYIRSAS